ncbi:hypothetical protein FDC50_16205 [Clostridium botulinum]|uniref:hypothetical protein n=1 Tax=unclassified Clostridium TaxID=2614128 RepID=UPI0002DBAEE2|nr:MULTISPECIES: hypothetical protein [unclassified Clostridium]KFX57258.1 hypothetical protein KU41_12740 [Clostridium botulinum]MBY6802547.1 hypothetical protein [Clostridium botulinum]MBY6819208.1 hypothetical protein [Clostridium botulinum]NFJ50623.1 hypothetical protein [Clostridium botulinum]NFP09130.1 hypothetical protein [Clostridium botulinum]
MAYVGGVLGKEIQMLMDESNSKYEEGNYNTAIELLERAWYKLPNKNVEYDESFLIVWGILDISILLKNKSKMSEWVDKIFVADPERGDTGEREMWAGRVAFEIGDRNKAKYYFEIANKKSKGRCFGNKDDVYKKFFENYK